MYLHHVGHSNVLTRRRLSKTVYHRIVSFRKTARGNSAPPWPAKYLAKRNTWRVLEKMWTDFAANMVLKMQRRRFRTHPPNTPTHHPSPYDDHNITPSSRYHTAPTPHHPLTRITTTEFTTCVHGCTSTKTSNPISSKWPSRSRT